MDRAKFSAPALLIATVVAIGTATPVAAAPAPNMTATAAPVAVSVPTAAKSTLDAAKPTIKGAATVGKKLTVKPGSWTAGTKFEVQWFAAGKKLPGKTGMTLKVTKLLVGKNISVKVTGTKAGYETVAKKSKTTAKVKAAPTVKVVRFKNCTEMRKVYPHGVGRRDAIDSTSGARVTNFFVHDALYAANAGSDRDKDGIACET